VTKHELKPNEIIFSKCPVCGETKTYCQELAIKEKALGHMRKELNFFLKVEQGVCLDQDMDPKLPFGTVLPSYIICYDVCANPECGLIRVVKIVEDMVVKQKRIDIATPGQNPDIPPFFRGGKNPFHN